MATIVFDIANFRAAFPEFASETTYPDALLQRHWDNATCYISDNDYGCLSGDCRANAINLMTAHLTRIESVLLVGGHGGFVNSATVDKVSVSLTPPPSRNQYSWWLSTTPYGQQLSALLKAKSVGGCYIGGSLERASFRKAGGAF